MPAIMPLYNSILLKVGGPCDLLVAYRICQK